MDALGQQAPDGRGAGFDAALVRYLATATAALTVEDRSGNDTWVSSYALADAMCAVIECFPRQRQAEAGRKATVVLEQIVGLRRVLSRRWWELPRRGGRGAAGATALQSAIDGLRADFYGLEHRQGA